MTPSLRSEQFYTDFLEALEKPFVAPPHVRFTKSLLWLPIQAKISPKTLQQERLVN